MALIDGDPGLENAVGGRAIVMILRAFAIVAAGLAWLPATLLSPGASARPLHVSASFPCPDPTVCDCSGSPPTCFRFLTIASAMSAAVAGDSVLVRGGFYGESVGLKNGVVLLGGYDPTFTSRDPVANVTMIHGGNTSPPLFSGPGVGNTSIVDGFTISGGGGNPGCGVLIRGGAPVLRNNRIVNNWLPGIAGGVYISQGSTARLENNVIADNSTQGSGGGVRADFASLTLVGNTIERNHASHSGAAIYVTGGSVICISNVIRENTAGDGGGGGAYLQEALAATTFTGNDFIDNTGAYGGGIMVKDQSTATFTDNDFSSNVATLAGGGIAVFGGSTVTLTSNRFTDCIAGGSHGGGVFVHRSTANVTGSDATGSSPDASFIDCTALGSGGGFYASRSTGVLSGIRVQDCEADSLGGGIFLDRSTFTVTENLIVDCTGFDAGGIAVFFNNVAADIITTCPVLSNTVYGCTGTNMDEPVGGIGLFANRQAQIAGLAGNIIAFTRQGSALRCKTVPAHGSGLPARPMIVCSTFHMDPTNSTPADDAVDDPDDIDGNDVGGPCQSAFSSDATNRIGDPFFCSAFSGNFMLQDCSPDVGTSCELGGGPSGENRGVPYPFECVGSCLLASLEPSSWGRIKASYR